jgi:acyl-CoA thioester hydrolase
MNLFQWPVRVYYEDTDAGGVVYYANYLKFFERAHTEWLRDLGFGQQALMREAGIVFAVRHVEIDYLLPARFDDDLTVEVEIAALSKVSITFEQRLRRDDSVLSRAAVKVVCLNRDSFRPVAIPANIAEKMRHAQQ